MSDVRDSEAISSATPAKLDEPNGTHTTMDAETADSPVFKSSELEGTMHDNSDEAAKFDKLDELTSLEREIAELHHVEPTAPSVAKKVKDGGAATMTHEDFHRDKVLLEMQPLHRNSAASFTEEQLKHHVGGNAGMMNQIQDEIPEPLEEEDLIAVLKGVVDNDHKSDLADDSNDVAVGVTIEGEGEFQIMEIDDDFDEAEEMKIADSNTNVTTATTNIYVSSLPKLTKEEERNLAMEQIQGLNSRKENSRKPEQKSRRKQDIKPLPVESTDLVSMLGADWSDDEMIADPLESPAAAPKDAKPIGNPATKNLTKTISTTTITTSSSSNVSSKEKPSEKAKRRNSPPKITSVVMFKSATVPQQQVESKVVVETAVIEKKKEPEPQTSVATIPPITGFKRTRIIKRKIIWDPDAPETTFSYAQLVRPSNISPPAPKVKNESSKPATTVAVTSTATKAAISTATKAATSSATKAATASNSMSLSKKNQEPAQKKVRPATPKDRKLSAHSDIPSVNVAEVKRAPTPKIIIKSSTSTTVVSPISPKETTAAKQQIKTTSDSTSTSPGKRRSQTPVANGANKKKKISEIDRLMGDEGAVNMLNSLESERQKKANELNEVPKPNMRSRSATISEKFVKRDLTPSKKEAQVVVKTKRTVKPKASSSWDYVYKQQASEDSMIIRRRSNSSYSSSASVHRLSLDASPANSTKNTSKAALKTNKAAAQPPRPDVKMPAKSANQATAPDTSVADNSLKTLSTPPTVKAFEFAKPESKTQQKIRKTKSPQVTNPLAIDMKKSSVSSVNNRRTVRSPATVEDKEKEKSTIKSPTNIAKDDVTPAGVVVKKWGKVAQIIFNTYKSKIEHTFNIELLNNFIEVLHKLESDSDCHAVAVTTNAANFCQGLDISELAVGSLEKRKKIATQLGAAVKHFLKTLATFPKPLIAGVNGANIGLGVMILPLFDIIIASDKGSYETPYAKIGQIPEGYCIWNAKTKIRGTFKTKLFWLSEKLHSTESALSGLVNKLTTPNKVNEDTLASAKRIASLSVETYRSMKKTTIDANEDIISIELEQEFKTIIEQWSSEECFENFKKYTQTGHW